MNPLTIFPRHPSAPDTYYINGAWAPAAITAVDKRFTDAELAAEYHCAEMGTWLEHFGIFKGDEEEYWKIFETFIRFATLPHHDDGPA